MATEEVLEWVQSINRSGSSIGVDDGGLTLVEIGADGKATGCYLEVGGVAKVYECDSCDWNSTEDPNSETCPQCKEGHIIQSECEV